MNLQVKLDIIAFEKRCLEALMNGEKASNGALMRRDIVISDIKSFIENMSATTEDEDILKLADEKRIAMVIDINRGLIQRCGSHGGSISGGALLAFPADELISIRPEDCIIKKWKAKWISEGGQLYDGRMIALKDDEIWKRISIFNLPFPPFDLDGDATIRNISRREAISLGVMTPGYKLKPITTYKVEFTDWTLV